MSDPSTPKLRALVIDDDEGMRMLLRVSLELDGRFVVLATLATKAELDAYFDGQNAPLDVAVVDVTLPDADGVNVIEELRARFDDAVLALYRGWSDPLVETRARHAGADHVFTKALDPQGLIEQLAQPRPSHAP
jgi:DNA-binding response OmpR family regulator